MVNHKCRCSCSSCKNNRGGCKTPRCGCPRASNSPVSLLKFAGILPNQREQQASFYYLADQIGEVSSVSFRYPVAASRVSFSNLSVSFTPFSTGSITVRLLHQGNPAPGYTLTINAGDTSPQGRILGPEVFENNDVFDLQVFSSELNSNVTLSATIAVSG